MSRLLFSKWYPCFEGNNKKLTAVRALDNNDPSQQIYWLGCIAFYCCIPWREHFI